MYKKTKKTIEHPYGIKKVAIQNLNRPIVFFSVPFCGEKQINGYMSKLLYLLRFRNNNSINTGLDISDAPFDMYCDSMFEPDIISKLLKDVKKDDITSLRKLFRNINFVSYCEGNEKLLSIIKSIHNQLKENGFNELKIKDLMSQISVLQIVDNLGVDGKTFPYVTTNTVHIKQDVANLCWLESDDESKDGQFSKAFVKKVKKNRQVIVLESFGEESLIPKKEHDFTDNYLSFPVMNSLMAICLIDSITSSLKGTKINLDYYSKSIDYILTKAHEYEVKIGKDLESLSKKELNKFSEYMMAVISGIVKERFKIGDIDKLKIKKELVDEQALRTIASRVEINYVGEIKKIIKNLLANKDFSSDEEGKVSVGNFKRTLSVDKAIETIYGELVSRVKSTINKINDIDFDCEVSGELKTKLLEWKRNKIIDIYEELDNEELRALLSRCGLNLKSEIKH